MIGDRFFDTPRKRSCAFLLLTALLLLLAALPNLYVGLSLYQVDQYDSLFALLKGDLLNISFISRCAFAMISYASITLPKILLAIVQSLHFFEYVLITICLIFIIKRNPLRCSRWLWISLISFIGFIIIAGIQIHQGFSAGSLNFVISKLHTISIALMIQSSIQIIMSFICIYCCIMQEYLPAMQEEIQLIEE